VLQGRRNVCIGTKQPNALTNVCFNKAKGPWVALTVEILLPLAVNSGADLSVAGFELGRVLINRD
jgi:hypothetical protein